MAQNFKKYRLLILLIAFLALWTWFLWQVGPEALVRFVGVENTYLAAFVLAVSGGLSTLTGVSFFALVATFAAGGANPLGLGLAGGLGIFISDLIFFLIARHGVTVFSHKLKSVSRWLVDRTRTWPEWLVLVLVYIYLGFTPLPNDLLMVALAIINLPLKRLAPVVLAGSLTIVTLTAYLSLLVAGFL